MCKKVVGKKNVNHSSTYKQRYYYLPVTTDKKVLLMNIATQISQIIKKKHYNEWKNARHITYLFFLMAAYQEKFAIYINTCNYNLKELTATEFKLAFIVQ